MHEEEFFCVFFSNALVLADIPFSASWSFSFGNSLSQTLYLAETKSVCLSTKWNWHLQIRILFKRRIESCFHLSPILSSIHSGNLFRGSNSQLLEKLSWNPLLANSTWIIFYQALLNSYHDHLFLKISGQEPSLFSSCLFSLSILEFFVPLSDSFHLYSVLAPFPSLLYQICSPPSSDFFCFLPFLGPCFCA